MKDITSWDEFHDASFVAFGFPEFYGRNNNAWIDCLSYLDQENGMSAFVLGRDEVIEVLLSDFREFSEQHPDIALGIIQLFAFVNSRYAERGDFLRLRLTLT